MPRLVAAADDDVPVEKMRRFRNAEEDELLPLKIGGKLVRQYKNHDIKEDIKEEVEETADEKAKIEVDDQPLTAQQLLKKQKQLMQESRERISCLSNSIVHAPEENICRLKDLYDLCVGAKLDPLVREVVQKLSVASLTQVFMSIIPGYRIRKITETEENQKMKGDTKKLFHFESTLLTYYQQFLQLLEKNSMKLVRCAKLDESTFTAKFGILCTRCLCKLLDKASHFNYAVNVINCLIQLTKSTNEKIVNDICDAISGLFCNDVTLEMSLNGAKAIAHFVNVRKGYVSPRLVATFLSLKIKEVEKGNDGEDETPKKGKAGSAQRLSKNQRKELKRKRKVEDPLREAEAAEKMSRKLKLATETMNHVFTTYFCILKRMPTTALLPPVLEGLAKFGHLINVEFFEDLVHLLSNLVEQKHLKLTESLYCVKTVCAILSNEGHALNIDPLKFYISLYALLPALFFQEDEAVLSQQVGLLVDSLHVLLVKRRRLVPLKRCAAFVKRLLLLALAVPTRPAIALLATVRTIFIAHNGLSVLIAENDAAGDEEDDLVTSGVFYADFSEPDCSNSLSTIINVELMILYKKHSSQIVRAFALNIRHQASSSGDYRLNAQWATTSPRAWLYSLETPNVPLDNQQRSDVAFRLSLKKYCTQKKITMTSKNICSTICAFLDQVRTSK